MHRYAPLGALFLALNAEHANAQSAAATAAFRLFGNIDYWSTQRPVPDGFRVGQIALHTSATLSDRLSAFGELSGTSTSTGFNIEAERYFVRYDHNDRLKVSAGRVHTPISYWNTTYHHGQWMQTTVARPDVVRIGGGLVPLHFVGLMAEGLANTGPVSLSYSVGLGNGRGVSIARASDAGDANKSRAIYISTGVRLPPRTGIKVGAAYYVDRATPSPAVDMDERISSIYLAREKETPELIIEYASIAHAPRAGGKARTRSESYYAQLGYRLPGSARQFKPYVRVERTHTPLGDDLFDPLKLGYKGALGGIRYDPSPMAALKLEYRAERVDRSRLFRSLVAQLSFIFPGALTGAHDDHSADAGPLSEGAMPERK